LQNKTLNEYLSQLKNLVEEKKFEPCIDLLLDAIRQYPDDSKLKLNLGNVYKVTGEISNAKEIYSSLLLTSYKEIAQNNLALIMLEEGQIDKGIKYAREAIKNNPNYADAKFNLSLGLFEKKQYSESLEICNELISDLEYKHRAYELKIRINQIVCSWSTFNQTEELLKSNKISVHPFLHVSYVMDEEKNYNNAVKWDNSFKKDTKNKHFVRSSQMIKLGFLCGEIRDHPTFYLIKNLFINLKKSNISVFMFSYNHDENKKSYIEESFDEFVDITDLNFKDGYEKIKSYNLDILVDLTTIISHNRIGMLDKNIAKIIIAYLAFPGTTGSDIYDYILTDKITTPESMQKYYKEIFLYLPDGYQVNNGELNTEVKTKRELYSLPQKGIILGCLNQSFKLDPIFFSIWIDILYEYENTYLWLLDEGKEMKDNIISFINNKINIDRIIFADKVDYVNHLERIQHIDIALDTRIYNGHTTSIEMLQAGVPLVTLEGNHFASRVSTSILSVLGLKNLITNSSAEYKDKIISLIDSERRVSIKKTLMHKLKTSKILDNKHFSENFIKTIVSSLN
tara:strand:- start:4237 stop:5937 length:1701 start_codon:yes stop_codon:yes gene_type:complete